MEKKDQPPRKLTVLLDHELEQRLNEEVAKFEREHGVAVSMNQIATKAMRQGFDTPKQ